jgi:glycogen debranching enzyme
MGTLGSASGTNTVLGQPLAEALKREWLITDGLGGYASGTVAGPNTRRYHGLLVAPLAPPLGRTVLLARLEEALDLTGSRYALSSNEFEDGTIHPRGFEYLADFSLVMGVPVWRYVVAGAEMEKRIWMDDGRSTVFVAYTWRSALPAQLELQPLCAFRDFHRETVGSEDWRFAVERLPHGLTVRAYAGATPYHLLVAPPAGGTWSLSGQPGWWWHFLHRAEQERGLDCVEDLFAIGTIACTLEPGQTLTLAATIEDPVEVARRLDDLTPPRKEERSDSGSFAGQRSTDSAGLVRPRSPLPSGEASQGVAVDDDAFVTQLRRASGQFLVARALPGEPTPRRQDGRAEARTVLAGYHWFGDWGRDTMIALPGLALATGRHDEACAILRAFARYVDKGMLPNRFPDSGAPLSDGDYNTVDAALWFFRAVDVLDRHVGRPGESAATLVADLYPVLAEIVEWHVLGTRFGIRVDAADGLIRVDDPQLTWMDAKVGDWVVTPRAGKPVEIAGLWHHALGLMEAWARRLGRSSDVLRFGELRQLAAGGISRRFWYQAGGYLLDTIDGEAGDDTSFRPSQIIAAALPDFPLAPDRLRSVVDVVCDRLWTPRGLRTLAPDDPRYCAHYGGDPRQRDGAYHQGTVWPWLLGPLVDAHLRAYGDPARARRLVAPLQAHLFDEAAAGSISEIFDGDPPYAAGGCIAQAWSVAEVYRAWLATEPAEAGGK